MKRTYTKKPVRPRNTAATGVELRILEKLARYRFLTPAMLKQAGVAESPSYLGERLNGLLAGGLVRKSSPQMNFGKLAHFWWLTPKGASQLEDELGEPVRAPKKEDVTIWIYEHLKGQARSALALDAIAACYSAHVAPLVFDYENKPNEQVGVFSNPLTALPVVGQEMLVPDILAGVVLPDGLRPVAVEYETGGQERKRKNLLEKLPKYDAAFDSGVIGEFFGVPDESPRVLVVCKDEILLQRILKGWPSQDAEKWEFFFLQTIDAIEADPQVKWHRIGQAPSPLFKAE